jgi:exonuclease III
MSLPNENIVVWNPRGLNAPNRGTVVCTAVEDAAASIVCIVESKLASVDIYAITRILGPRFDKFVALPATNTAGGIIVAWQDCRVQVLSSQINSFSVTIELCFPGGEPWALSTVYGPTQDNLKVQFLKEIRATRLAFQGTWAIARDFNLILDAADKNNAMLNRRMMGRFRRLLNDLELKEQPLVGRRYTWSNERQAPTLGKLDRWFATVEWDMSHPDCLLQALSSSMSDHCPIMLSTNVSMNRKSRFHF